MASSAAARRRVVCWLGLLAGGVLGGYAVLLEPYRIEVRRSEFACPGLLHAPIRLLLLSDVGFSGLGRRERAVQRIAEEFQADLVLVAGDLLARRRQIRDPRLVAEARQFLLSLPAAHGRLLVPGEAEAADLAMLVAGWGGPGLTVMANQSVRVEVRGEMIDLFGADLSSAPEPWALGQDGQRGFVHSRGRWVRQELMYPGQGDEHWRDVEITVAFQALDSRSYLDLRFGWASDQAGDPNAGWQLIRNGRHRPFRLRAKYPGRHQLSGRLGSDFVPPPGVWCRARIRVEDTGEATRIRARLWREADDEPQAWMIDALDQGDERRRSGTVGFGGREGGRRYADLTVRTLSGEVLLAEDFRDPRRWRARWRYPSELAAWLRRPGSAAVRIILTHHPDLALDVAAVGEPAPSLLLAGHTHGGQIALPGLGPLFVPSELGRRHARGWSVYAGLALYVTAGVGTSFIPARLLVPPEVALLTLTPAPTDPAPAAHRKAR